MATPVTVVKATGTNYEIGEQVGRAVAALARKYVAEVLKQQPDIERFYDSAEGRNMVSGLLISTTMRYPQFVQELKGFSKGSGIEFIKLWLIQLIDDLIPYLRQKQQQQQQSPPEKCTDLLLNTATSCGVVHSEDLYACLRDDWLILEASVTPSRENGNVGETYTSFVYPGMLAGYSFATNGHGLCTSVNVTRQVSPINIAGIPSTVAQRAMMSAPSIQAALYIVQQQPGVASGFVMNLSQKTPSGEYEFCNVEVVATPSGTVIDRRDVTGFDFHCNDYLRLRSVSGSSPSPSSTHRAARIQEITTSCTPTSLDDLLHVISDVSDVDYPIYRTGSGQDKMAATGCVALFDLRGGRMSVYKDRPSISSPVYSAAIPAHYK